MIYDTTPDDITLDNRSAPGLLAHLAYGPRPRLAELDSEIMRIAGLTNAIEYKFIKLLGEFDELDGWVGDGVKSFAHWLNWVNRQRRFTPPKRGSLCPSVDSAAGGDSAHLGRARDGRH